MITDYPELKDCVPAVYDRTAPLPRDRDRRRPTERGSRPTARRRAIREQVR